MQYPIVLAGTYHKTGTLWIHRVMRGTARALGIDYHMNFYQNNRLDTKPPAPSILFDDHALFPEQLAAYEVVGFRMIRDPRDVVISGAHYHLRSDEEWLHCPEDHLGGQSYSQAINASGGGQAQYCFEMQHTAADTIKQMTEPSEFVSTFQTVRYEDLMVDTDFSRFKALVKALGFSLLERRHAVKADRKSVV